MITLFSLNLLIINKNSSSIVLKNEFVNLDKSLLFKMSSYFFNFNYYIIKTFTNYKFISNFFFN